MACILKRKSVIAVSFIAAFLFLLVVRLVNEVNFPLLLNCFGQPGTKWIPFSYTYRRPLRTHYGYINVRTQEPLQLDCDLCAIVSNSGQMVGQKVGNEIDQCSCIWRMNNAPTRGYEEDVGRMTTIRVVSHTSVPLLLKNPDYFFKEANTTIYVIWGPFRNMRKDGNGIVYNMLKKTVDVYPNAQIYVTTEKRMSHCDGIFKKETGKDSILQVWPCSMIESSEASSPSLPSCNFTYETQHGQRGGGYFYIIVLPKENNSLSESSLALISAQDGLPSFWPWMPVTAFTSTA
ncbi:alpha-N-acetylgalactosaminide alpha-2,6-sialyltransferase 3 isoform X3 [Diceros bicornis minor]|uniref:alpha-N-acetylgalactosaminide alpha-2,6-sialyltransferase 3 isoform X3 n=1 Tax=Diceros bicornis minor TaxID=77932 RepID=UPI0026F08B7D|nr:alpha-N-acetylgalactosaminide alpha-2,6-sialyltransferase 3 isoform X3 [Diceros bicornis minor]XP_058394301.1 alpha-N-acetylgalactosaminide alpha-2,6-sialyltransferase 3 isoform X3 [Diceros bicornis minor]